MQFVTDFSADNGEQILHIS